MFYTLSSVGQKNYFSVSPISFHSLWILNIHKYIVTMWAPLVIMALEASPYYDCGISLFGFAFDRNWKKERKGKEQ